MLGKRVCKFSLCVPVAIGILILIGAVVHGQELPDQPIIPPRLIVTVHNQYGDPAVTTVTVQSPEDVQFDDSHGGVVDFYFDEQFIGETIDINVQDQFSSTIIMTGTITMTFQITVPLPGEDWANLNPTTDIRSFGQCVEVETIEDRFSSASWRFFLYEDDLPLSSCPEGGFQLEVGKHEVVIVALQSETSDRLVFEKSVEVIWVPKNYFPSVTNFANP